MMGLRQKSSFTSDNGRHILCQPLCDFLFCQALPVLLADAAGLLIKSIVSITCMEQILHHERDNRIREFPSVRNILILMPHNGLDAHHFGAFCALKENPRSVSTRRRGFIAV